MRSDTVAMTSVSCPWKGLRQRGALADAAGMCTMLLLRRMPWSTHSLLVLYLWRSVVCSTTSPSEPQDAQRS